MLPRKHRLVERQDFSSALRFGGRGGNRFLVVAVAVSHPGTAILHTQSTENTRVNPPGRDVDPARVGFIVAKKELPHAVDRNRAKRQLRHLMADRLQSIPNGSLVVIRVLAPIKGKSSKELAVHLDRALATALRKATAMAAGGAS